MYFNILNLLISTSNTLKYRACMKYKKMLVKPKTLQYKYKYLYLLYFSTNINVIGPNLGECGLKYFKLVFRIQFSS